MRLIGDAGQSSASSPVYAVKEAAPTLIGELVFNAQQSPDFELAVEQTVHKIVLEPYIVDAISVRAIDARALIAFLAIFVKNEVWEVLSRTGQNGRNSPENWRISPTHRRQPEGV